MKRSLSILAALVILVSCSDEDTITTPEPCTPSFNADSLQVEVRHIYLPLLQQWVWGVTATYKYELEGCSGKIHTHEFTFSEVGAMLFDIDNTIADCFEPINVQLDKTVNASIFDDVFNGYDSVTVYFSLRGLFQQCSGGSADSIAAISWSDTVRAEVID